jgi:hypothetical protein
MGRLVDQEQGIDPADRGADLRQQQTGGCWIERLGETRPVERHVVVGVLAADELGEARAQAPGDHQREQRQQIALAILDPHEAELHPFGSADRPGEGTDPVIGLIGGHQCAGFKGTPVGLDGGEIAAGGDFRPGTRFRAQPGGRSGGWAWRSIGEDGHAVFLNPAL